MKNIAVGIVGTGAYLPPNIITNKDLEKMVDTTDEWIKSRSGIEERRVTGPDMATSDMAVEAAKKALVDAGVGPEEIELIIMATVTPDNAYPSAACTVQQKLGAVNAAAFDLAAGCSGYMYGLAVGTQFIKSGFYKKVLVIGGDNLSKFTNWSDRATCVLFGDGAGGAVLSEVEEGYGLLSFELGADGTGGELLILPAGGSKLPASEETVRQGLHYTQMSGNEVYKFAVRIMDSAVKQALEKIEMKPEDLDYLVPHQANIRIITHAARRLKMPMDKVFVNLHKYGNTSAGSIAIALDEAKREGKIKRGDLIAFVGFGAGLTWGAGVCRWV
jgi:3-oxoacyl-[acyl-carrier-protein] synthase-3